MTKSGENGKWLENESLNAGTRFKKQLEQETYRKTRNFKHSMSPHGCKILKAFIIEFVRFFYLRKFNITKNFEIYGEKIA